jgi:hypothetical protein
MTSTRCVEPIVQKYECLLESWKRDVPRALKASFSSRETDHQDMPFIGSKILDYPIPIAHIFSFLDIQSIARVEQTCKLFQKAAKRDGWEMIRMRLRIMTPSVVVYGLECGTPRQCDRRKVPTRDVGWKAIPPLLPYVLSSKIQVRLLLEARRTITSLKTVSIQPSFPKESSKYLFYVCLSGRHRTKSLIYGGGRILGLPFSDERRPLFEGFLADQVCTSGNFQLSLRPKGMLKEGVDEFRSRLTRYSIENVCEDTTSHEETRKKLFQRYRFRVRLVAFQITSQRMRWRRELVLTTTSLGTNVKNDRCCVFLPRLDIDRSNRELNLSPHDSDRLKKVCVSLHVSEDYRDLDFIELCIQN